MKKIKKWWADIKDFPCFLLCLLPFIGETTEKLARNNTEKLRSNLAREYRANKNWHEKGLFCVTENRWLWGVFSVISFFLLLHIFPFLQEGINFFLQKSFNFLGNTQKNDADFLILTAQHVIFFLHEVVNFFGDTRKSDANFLVSTVQATLMGVIIPILIAVSDIRNPIDSRLARDFRIQHAKLYVFLWSSVLLLVVAALVESFFCISNAYYLGQYFWFAINLLLFIRVIIVYFRRADGDVVSFAEDYAQKIEMRIADKAFQDRGDRLND